MSKHTIKLLVVAALLVHALGHGIVMIAQVMMSGSSQASASGWLAAQSWLFPSLAPSAATTLACVLSFLALIGFVAAAMAFWGVVVPGGIWRQLALTSAIVSTVGIVLFLGTWAPTFNTLAALSANIAVLVALLGLHWSPQAVLSK